jgi:hypothetical protein
MSEERPTMKVSPKKLLFKIRPSFNPTEPEITSHAMWRELCPPRGGSNQLVKGNSAWELISQFFPSNSSVEPHTPIIPSWLNLLLREMTVDDSCEITGVPEVETNVDLPSHKTHRIGRNHDMVILWKTIAGQRCVACVEAKASESFSCKIGPYYRKHNGKPASRIPERINHMLSDILNLRKVDEAPAKDIHYQLLHACAGTLLEGAKHNAAKVILAVVGFKESTSNDRAFQYFINLLSNEIPLIMKSDFLFGPFNIPGGVLISRKIPLYMIKTKGI